MDVTGAGYDGARLENCHSYIDANPDPAITEWVCMLTSTVSITSSTFTGNAGTGVFVDSSGSITLDAVSADNNATGADLNADSGVISVANASTFTDNNFYGLQAGIGSGNVILSNVTASGNQYGAIVGTDAGNITISASTFDNNSTSDPEYPGIGLQAGTSLGDVSLSFVTATGNDIGATVGSEQGNVNVAASTFSDNGYVGLAAGTMQGTVTLTDVVANGVDATTLLGPVPLAGIVATTSLAGPNQAIGAIVGNMDGSITIMGSIFNGNAEKGLYIKSTGIATDPDVTLLGVSAIGNGLKGAYIEYLAPCGTTTGGVNVSLNSGDYETNGGYGIYAAIGPDGTLTTVVPPCSEIMVVRSDPVSTTSL